MYKDPLLRSNTLEVYSFNTLIFSSEKKWLYPLFELSSFLASAKRENLSLHDKISGAAAAVLIISLGIKKVNADVISKKAIAFYDKYSIIYSFGTMVESIKCKTEGEVDISLTIEENVRLLEKKLVRKY